MSDSNQYQKDFSMDIIALFRDINHFLFLKDKQITTYDKGGIRQIGFIRLF